MSKKLKSTEKIWLFQGNCNLHFNRIGSEWSTEIAVIRRQQREQANVGDVGARVKQLCDRGRVTETAFVALSTHGARTKGLGFGTLRDAIHASGSINCSQRPVGLPLKRFQELCDLLSFPISCKFSFFKCRCRVGGSMASFKTEQKPAGGS